MVAGRLPWPALAALVVWLGALPLAAQLAEHGAFRGTVLDEQGQPLVGATVVFRGLDFELQRETQTDKNGSFYYGGFRPGRYHITILRGPQIVWAYPVTLPSFLEALWLEIDLKKMHEAAERFQRLDPELEQQLKAERERREHTDRLHGHYTSGVRYLKENRPEKALEEFRAALEMEPDRATTYSFLGTAAAAGGQLEQAIDYYRRALQLEPREAAHHNNLGTLLARRGQVEEAVASFDTAVRLDPDRAATYQFNRGAALLNAGRAEEALPAFRQAVRLDPTVPVAHYFLGLALLRTSPRRTGGPEGPRLEPRSGTAEAFLHYLELEPEGEYAGPARETLKLLGVEPPAGLLPEPSPNEARG